MSVFLERLRMQGFGAFSDKRVGPFKPGMNVVYGKNEAGKTTTAKFIEGVLFGWEADRGARNTYRPAGAERTGSMVFVDEKTGVEREVSRARNADGLQGSPDARALFDDIDKETFSTMFSLTSDELRSLRNTPDVTARLLTAGSGTAASPAHALADVNARLAALTSRAAGAEDSIVNLRARREELRAQVAQAAEASERAKAQDKELRELEPQRADLQERLRALNAEIERLTAAQATLARLDESIADADERIAQLNAQEQDARRDESRFRAGMDASLAALDDAADARVRETLDNLAEERARREHAVEIARENNRTSTASYRAFMESEGLQEGAAPRAGQRSAQLVISTLLPIVLLGAGIPTFIVGRMDRSLSISMIGVGLVVCGVLMAIAAMVLLFRPPHREEQRGDRQQSLRWVMLQDEKKLEACEADVAEHGQTIAAYLESVGLAGAHGSLRHARTLLDNAKEARAQLRLFAQRRQAIASQRTSVESRLDEVYAQRDALENELAAAHASVGLAPGVPVSAATLSQALAAKVHQRDGLQEALDRANHRAGELKSILAAARAEHRFEALKFEAERVQTRLNESCDAYARLLLARSMLSSAISVWESRSQPEVYAQASRLMARMTGGAWTEVRMNERGRLSVVDAFKAERDPLHLSLGTCQQLYLSLRIALLTAADHVGRVVPILADDILVNFDDERRRGAAEALAELARTRQVIMFTCHKDMAKLMQKVDPGLNLVKL